MALVVQLLSALAAGMLSFTTGMDLADTEAGGGQLTGPLIAFGLFGSVALVVCAALLFMRRTVVTVVTAAAALFCLPLLLYCIAPSSLAWLSDAPSSVVPAHALNFDPLAVGGVVAVLVLAAACTRVPTKADQGV